MESMISAATLTTALAEEATPSARPVPMHSGRGGLDAVMVRPEALEANPFQPRGGVDEAAIAGLAQSLRETGMLQPIVARRNGTRLEIVAGERRWRAARRAGLDLVPVLIRAATDEQMLEMALVENIQRTDLNAIEKGRGYRRLCEEFSLSPEEVGRRVGEDRTTVTNFIRLLDLPREVMDMVSVGAISMAHARCVLGEDVPERQVKLARVVMEHQLSVRALEEIMRRGREELARSAAPAVARPMRAPHVAELENRFRAALGVKVTIKEGRRKGRGRIVLEYRSLDDFDRIAAAIGVRHEGT